MEKIDPSVTEAEFAILVKRAGLPITEADRATLYGIYGHVEAMLERNRGPGQRPRAAEPAHIFVPGQS